MKFFDYDTVTQVTQIIIHPTILAQIVFALICVLFVLIAIGVGELIARWIVARWITK